jgi:hypothetical protein
MEAGQHAVKLQLAVLLYAMQADKLQHCHWPAGDKCALPRQLALQVGTEPALQ